MCRGIDCMKKFCKSLIEHAVEILNFEKKKNILPKEQQESYKNSKVCFIYKEKIGDKCTKGKKYPNVRDYCPYTGE